MLSRRIPSPMKSLPRRSEACFTGPTFLPLPEFAVNLILGEMGDAFLLDSTRVVPKRLLEAGYKFQYTELKSALEHAVK